MTCTALIRLWKLVDIDAIRRPEAFPPGTELYWRGSMKLGTAVRPDAEVPVLINHDRDRVIGRVQSLVEIEDVDGDGWLMARAEIDNAPHWLQRGTKASICTQITERLSVGTIQRVVRGFVPEVSVLPPGVQPAEPLAQVISLRSIKAPLKTSAAAVTASRHVAAAVGSHGREEIASGGLIRRPGIGQVLGVH